MVVTGVASETTPVTASTNTPTPPGCTNYVRFTGDFAYDYRLLRHDLGWDKSDVVGFPHTTIPQSGKQESTAA